MEVAIWIGFFALITFFIGLDLGVFNRNDHVVTLKESLLWTCVWVTLALCFNGVVYYLYEQGLMHPPGVEGGGLGKKAAIEFFTGYLIEYSLSIDNIFVMAVIIGHFRVPQSYQHRLLFWGILGAAILRAIMIFAGTALITEFKWLIYVFGAMLIFSAVKMLVTRDETLDTDENWFVKLVGRVIRVSKTFHGHHFFAKENGQRVATPMFVALMLIESTDVMFAIDSIPAVFSVTTDPFIVFTSNIFAILGLRSLYFALAGMIDKFHYLKMSLVFLLAFVGAKMLLSGVFHIPNEISLGIIAAILAVGVLASLLDPSKSTDEPSSHAHGKKTPDNDDQDHELDKKEWS